LRGRRGRLTLRRPAEQPFKIPFVAAIVLTVNTLKPEFTSEILAKVGATLQKHVDAGLWREVKLYMRLLGCLQGMFEGDGIFPLLEQFFERAADLQMQSSEDVSILVRFWDNETDQGRSHWAWSSSKSS
jgi:nuclear cap-binding protein subunit 1